MALGDRWSGSPGWLFGRLDFGLARGPNLCQIDRVSGAKDREDEIRKIRLGRRKLEFEQAFFLQRLSSRLVLLGQVKRVGSVN